MPRERQGSNLAVFISGGGTGLQAFIDATRLGILSAKIVLVVSSNSKAYGLERAGAAGIETCVHRIKDYSSRDEADRALLKRLTDAQVDFIALAGYLKLVPVDVVAAYRGRIVNIHPALLPRYGGKGMYGHHVHEAVIAAGDRESGVSVHFVDEAYDHGRVLDQVKVPVEPDDTPETLAERVQRQEHKFYPRVLEKLIRGDYNASQHK